MSIADITPLQIVEFVAYIAELSPEKEALWAWAAVTSLEAVTLRFHAGAASIAALEMESRLDDMIVGS